MGYYFVYTENSIKKINWIDSEISDDLVKPLKLMNI